MFAKPHPKIKTCIVDTCDNTTRTAPDLTFVLVPKNPERRKIWLEALGRPDFGPNSPVHVCEKHFNLETDMDNYYRWSLQGGYKRMKPTAVPSLGRLANAAHTVKMRENNVMQSYLKDFVVPTRDVAATASPEQQSQSIQCEIYMDFYDTSEESVLAEETAQQHEVPSWSKDYGLGEFLSENTDDVKMFWPPCGVYVSPTVYTNNINQILNEHNYSIRKEVVVELQKTLDKLGEKLSDFKDKLVEKDQEIATLRRKNSLLTNQIDGRTPSLRVFSTAELS